ncbi:MAG TPA: glycoside hydrolase family 88 protein [Acidobacteriaceae bacterium]|jgi:rhamnogalacturonyl hydrolase YesR|nr:glycoside hydrolase family 88 protein [Acidobacteriaceae bacterium]
MSQLTRRRFGATLLFTASAATAPGLLRAQSNQRESSADPQANPLAQGGLNDWPKGYGPQELGTAVAEHFIPSPHFHTNRIVYPEVCAWYGALEIAHITRNSDLFAKLVARFEPLFTTESALLPPVGTHVDFSMFGSLPFELYLLTKDRRYLELGLKYADAQWAKPNQQGLTDETRFWIDDMYMITIVQVQAFRATGDRKYLDRAALEMTTYLEKLQQPNGLFFHAPDVPFFWGRGNGWFAAGMTEILRNLPHDHPQRARIERGYRTMMGALLRYQTHPGAWRQLIDNEAAWPETSGTGMFAFALISGVRTGLLDAATYGSAARRAWIALAGYVDQNDDVTSVCEGTNKLNDLAYYLLRRRRTGDFHGQAPLMWTAAALLR